MRNRVSEPLGNGGVNQESLNVGVSAETVQFVHPCVLVCSMTVTDNEFSLMYKPESCILSDPSSRHVSLFL